MSLIERGKKLGMAHLVLNGDDLYLWPKGARVYSYLITVILPTTDEPVYLLA